MGTPLPCGKGRSPRLAQRAPLVELRQQGAGRDTPGVKDPVAAYHALLDDDDRLTAASAEALASGQRERRLMFGERPLCVAIRPQILTRRRYERRAAYPVFRRL